MENILEEAVEKINKIQDGEKTIESVVATMNSVVDNVNRIAESVSTLVGKSKAPKEVKEAFGAFWEYVGFYVVLLVSISATFGFVKFGAFDGESVVKLALVLTSAILIGAIKEMLWKQITERDKTIDVLKEENKALETALSSQSIENSRLNVKYNKVVEYIRDKEPGFEPEMLFYPPKYSRMYTEYYSNTNKPVKDVPIVPIAPVSQTVSLVPIIDEKNDTAQNNEKPEPTNAQKPNTEGYSAR